MRAWRPALLACPALVALAACGEEVPEPAAVETEIPEELSQTQLQDDSGEGADAAEQRVLEADVARAAEIGSPMEERTATLGLLNKRNNVSQDIELKPGESRRVGDVIVRLSACERTAPWEMPQETGAFVQVLVQDRQDEDSWNRIFSGWLFRQSPSLNVVEHPVYDVWVKDCAMSFPGEEAGSASASEDSEA